MDSRINLYLNDLQNKLPKETQLFYTILDDATKALGGEITPFTQTNAELLERSRNLQFRLRPSGFYQTNPLQASNLFKLVSELAAAQAKDVVYDLYTGAGTIALHVAKQANFVIGIEANENSIEDANYNAQINGILNVKFIQGDVLASFTTDFVDSNPKPSIVILDPPRSGTLIEIKKTILYAQPHTIIYVSCNPAALAKDLKMLTTAYSIACIQPIDMFPHSHHIETVVKLVRRKEEDLSN
jgi:23S rRNA (uracil1939-C5)-methyltransferase